MRYIFTPLLLSILFTSCLFSQEDDKQLIQFTGVVVNENDSVMRFVTVYNTSIGIGTIGNNDGIFSIVANPSDTIKFSFVGYKPQYIVMPDSLDKRKLIRVVKLMEDTIYLDEANIYPWPTREGFKKAFMALDVSDKHPINPNAGFTRLEHEPKRVEPTLMSIQEGKIVSNPVSMIYESIQKSKMHNHKGKLAPHWQEEYLRLHPIDIILEGDSASK